MIHSFSTEKNIHIFEPLNHQLLDSADASQTPDGVFPGDAIVVL